MISHYMLEEGAIIPLGPVMNYVGEKKIDEIKLRIYPFETDGVSNFTVVIEDEMIEVEYCSLNGKHTVAVGETDIKVNVVMQGDCR